MDRAIRICFQWFVVVAAVLGGVAWCLNWLVIVAASAWLISICRQAAMVSRNLGPAGATFITSHEKECRYTSA
jgi:hypothetical protein